MSSHPSGIQIVCTDCGRISQVPADMRGKRVRCPVCQTVLTVPGQPPAPAGSQAKPQPRPQTTPQPRAQVPPQPRPQPKPQPRPQVTPQSNRPAPPQSNRPAQPIASAIIPPAPQRPAPPPPHTGVSAQPLRPAPRGNHYNTAPPRSRDSAEEGSSFPRWLIASFIGGGAALVLGIVVAIVLAMNSGSNNSPPAVTQKQTPNKPQSNLQNPLQNLFQNVPQDQPEIQPPNQVPKSLPALPDQMATTTVKQVKDATAYLRVTTTTGQTAEGSGFLAIEPGIIITNAHVLGMLSESSRPPQQVEVRLFSGEPNELRLDGKVLGVDRDTDLAVIRVQGNLPAPLRLDPGRELIETQKVYIFGFPFGEELGRNITVSPSEVSSLRKDPTGTLEKIQVNGGMHPGNSGGPVVNALGEVIGVSVAGIKGTQINFAVPAPFVGMLLSGRPLESDVGEPYQAGAEVRVPVSYTCLDPFNRIRKVKVDVWTGNTGTPRPSSPRPPQSLAGDGPKQSQAINYNKGLAKANLVIPAAGPGQVVWIQPLFTSANGETQWGTAQPVDPGMVITRQPANLTFQLKAQTQRTVQLKVSQRLTIIQGQKKSYASDIVELPILENLEDNPKGLLLATVHGMPRASYDDDGQKGVPDSQVPGILRQLPSNFVVDATNQMRERGDRNLNPNLPLLLRQQVNTYHEMITKGYELGTIILPNRQLQPQQTYRCQVPMIFFKTGKTATLVDLDLTCRYEGTRTRNGQPEALVSVSGQLVGRDELRGKADGKIAGKFTFHLGDGYITSAKMTITAEQSLAKDTQFVATFDVDLSRAPGNPLNLIYQPGGSPTPSITLAKIGDRDSSLVLTDPLDPLFGNRGSRLREFRFQMKAGKKYAIVVQSAAFDTYLRLVSPTGQLLAQDDDSGGGLNSRIDLVAPADGVYRIQVTSFNGQAGPFRLTVFGENGHGAFVRGQEPGPDLGVGLVLEDSPPPDSLFLLRPL
jgi:S1-C subfamily serine protease/DNA-directed RNA polymerase subunit RPC12/RpoP